MGRSCVVLGLVALVACDGASRVVGVACGGSSDCAASGLTGTCEPTGFCSYPDPACNGNRYSPGAGDGLANTCVGGPAACGTRDQACCAGDLCSSDLACVDATCRCGGDAQPCCGGETCDANLACAGGTCTCGSIGEPCCGGATCDTGLTCNAGSCTGGVLQIAVGWNFACALRTDHTVSCWGHNWKPYPFGNPGMSTPIIASETPQTVTGLTDVEEIRASELAVCARKTDKTLWCWGHNENGQLGDGTNTSSATPVQVLGLSNVSLFDGGRFHTCAVGTVDGVTTLWCWGHNSTGTRRGTPNQNLGRLGTGDIVDTNRPAQVDLSVAAGAGQTVRSLSTGGYHTCVAMSDNNVWCWGRGAGGALGNGAAADTKSPVAVVKTGITIPAGVTIDEVSCTDGNNGASSCLRLSNGKVHCWGSGTKGEMGDGTIASRNAPAAAVDTASLGAATIIELASGKTSHCGRASDNTVWCWGENRNSVLGDGTTTDRNTPQEAVGLTGAVQIDVSHRNACAVNGGNELFCWGNNKRFQATAAPSSQLAIGVPTKVNL